MQTSRWTKQWAFLVVLLALVMLAAVPGSGRATSYTFSPMDDATVYEINPNQNAGFIIANGAYSEPDIIRSYLKFDISSIPNSEIIIGGTLNLFVQSVGGNSAVDIYTGSNNTWTEGTITRNTQPGFGSLITSFANAINTWSQVNLPALNLNNPLFSLCLRSQVEATSFGGGVSFLARIIIIIIGH